MELANQSGRQQYDGALLIMRDILIFLALLTCFAFLYRIAPSVFCGATSVSMQAKAADVALPEERQIATVPILPTMEAEAAAPSQSKAEETTATAAAESAGMGATLDAATPDAISVEAPVTATADTAVSDAAAVKASADAQAPTRSAPTGDSPTGDFSAVFPAADTGAGALHSYQSDDMRIAITKIAESGVTYFVADVWVKNISVFKTAFAKGEYGRNIHEMPAKIAADNGAVFAVSGDYYGARDKGAVVRNGSLYRDVMNEDVCILRYDGTLEIDSASEFSSLQSLDETVWQAWAFGPALVKDGAACDTSGSKIKVKNPRCAIGFYEPGHYCFLVVDGRQDGYSSGMTLSELSSTFVTLGCKAAYNLDGGATAMMIFDGEVVNRPTHGGRASSDIICF